MSEINEAGFVRPLKLKGIEVSNIKFTNTKIIITFIDSDHPITEEINGRQVLTYGYTNVECQLLMKINDLSNLRNSCIDSKFYDCENKITYDLTDFKLGDYVTGSFKIATTEQK